MKLSFCFLLPLMGMLDHAAAQNLRGLQGLPPIDPSIFTLAVTIPTLDPFLAKFETPMALRFTNYFGAMWWNCVAVYSTDFKDTLTKALPVVQVSDTSLHTTASRAACMAQATATYNSLSLPDANPGYIETISGNNPFAGLGIAYQVDDKLDPFVAGCGSDVICLEELAISEGYSPAIMGHIVAKLVYDYSIEDGFNQLGKDDGCVVNCRAYKDITGYAPVVNPYRPRGKSDRWEPLLEDNGKGFFFRQEHVAAQIGTTAKFRYIPESDRLNRVAPKPLYTEDRTEEALKVIELMAGLDDQKKVEVEVFDDKLIVGNAIIDSFIGKCITSQYVDADFPAPEGTFLSLERFVSFVSGYLAAEYDSVVIAWKEKVYHDLIRPTSVIKRFPNDITTWALGGVQTFPAKNFEAYKRVMPHSEYVSGTACLFQSAEDYIKDYMTGMGLSTTFPVAFPEFAPGSSKVEPGVVPAQSITLQYGSIEEMAAVGSQSRLNGGMHFEDSVPAAKALCQGIGNIAAKGTFDLYKESNVE